MNKGSNLKASLLQRIEVGHYLWNVIKLNVQSFDLRSCLLENKFSTKFGLIQLIESSSLWIPQIVSFT